MKVLHPYAPTLADELELHTGTELLILRAFDDGWGLGMLPSTGKQGAFPLVCVLGEGGVGGGEGGEGKVGVSAEEGKRLSDMISRNGRRGR
jgi:hypothetical protein